MDVDQRGFFFFHFVLHVIVYICVCACVCGVYVCSRPHVCGCSFVGMQSYTDRPEVDSQLSSSIALCLTY